MSVRERNADCKLGPTAREEVTRLSGSIIALPATTRDGLQFGLPIPWLKGRLGWRPHLFFGDCPSRLKTHEQATKDIIWLSI